MYGDEERKKKMEKVDKPIMTVYGNKKEINSTKVNEVNPKGDMEDSKQDSLFSSPATEDIAKKLFKIASDSISEIIAVSGKLDKRGLCEAIMFNSNIILNDPVLQQKSFYEATSNDYLTLLYFLIQQQRTGLKGEKTKGWSFILRNIINCEMRNNIVLCGYIQLFILRH